MCATKLEAALKWNDDLWAPFQRSHRGALLSIFSLAVLVIYNIAISVTLVCAAAGGSMAASQVALNPALSGDAWIVVPAALFSIYLIEVTWIVVVLGICGSYILAGIRRFTPAPQASPKNEV